MATRRRGPDSEREASRRQSAVPAGDDEDRVGRAGGLVDALLRGCYLAFHRGVVSTLALAALGGLFLGVPQTAEVLRNIRDDALATRALGAVRVFGRDMPAWRFNDTDVLFVVTSIIAAGVLAVGTLVSVVGPATTPEAHLARCFRSRGHLLRASIRFTVFVATAALCLMQGAFLQASVAAPFGADAYAGWVAVALPIGVTFVLRLGWGASAWRLFEPGGWRVATPLLAGALSVVSSTLAAAVVFELSVRATLCTFAGVSAAWLAFAIGSLVAAAWGDDGAVAAEDAYRTAWAVFAASPVVVCLAVWVTPQEVIQSYGSGTLVLFQCIGLYWIGVLLSAGIRAWARDVPGVALGVAAVVMVALYVALPERYGRETLTFSGTPPPFDPPRTKWRAVPEGHFVAVHADGGGLRAAYFTAMVLAAADDATCGRFGRCVFALSGVSGGSLGVATWAMLRQEAAAPHPASSAPEGPPCRAGAAPGPPKPGSLQQRVHGTLIRDHLRPVLARMVGADAVPTPWWPATRGQALLDSWQSAALDTLQPAGVAGSPPQAFARRLDQTTAGLDPAPWLVFSATDAATGERVMQTNVADPQQPIASAPRPADRTPLGLAALDSARFPYLSPAGRADSASAPKARLLVDGGYFDNSGAASLLQLLESVPKPPGTLHLVRLDGNPSDDEVRRCKVLLGDAPKETRLGGWAGLDAYLATRTAHANAAVEQLHRLARSTADPRDITTYAPAVELRLSYLTAYDSRCAADDCRKRNERLCQEAIAYEAPLGWLLGQRTAEAMQPSIRAAAARLMEAAGFAH